MISDKSIQEVKDRINIIELIGSYVDLKQRGNVHTGCCPFHGEKTPSFTVSPVKDLYKCFGCGKSGNGITFIMEQENMLFPEAIKFLADKYNVTLEYDKTPELSKEHKEELEQMRLVLKAAQLSFQNNLLDRKVNEQAPAELLSNRRFNVDTILQFGYGFAPGNGFIKDKVLPKGLFAIAEAVGLVKNKEGRNYDVLSNRITIPIYDHRGLLVGFGSRDLSGKKDVAKYLNSPESKIYNKSRVLYGLNWAAKSIKANGYAILTEGYLDVAACHQAGIDNTVATCGTALTDEQAKLLFRYTQRVVVIRDSDNAGKKATLKDIDILVRNNFSVHVVTLPEGEDPDSFIRSGNDLKEYIRIHKMDAIIFKCRDMIDNAEDESAATVGINKIVQFLATIKQPATREIYINSIGKELKAWIKPASFAQQVKKYIEVIDKEEAQYLDEDDMVLPKGVDRDEFMNYGFYELIEGSKTGYWFASQGRSVSKISNFVIIPLFHVYSKTDNKRMIEINNGHKSKIVEMPSKALISLDLFTSVVYDEGFYLFEGTKQQLMKINSKIGDKFPMCYELKTLGWQPEGFFAYSNAVFYENDLKRFDEMGIVEVNGTKFLSLSASKIQQDVRQDEDIYKNDRYLSHADCEVTFEQWAELFNQVYGAHGGFGISFALATLFRDIIIKITKLPHLYGYGDVGSGKSEFGDSIGNLFFNKMPAFNLNQGTDFAFFSRMERFRNCPNVMNEFDEYAIKEEWFRAIKAAYDLEGREKGRGLKEKTRTQEINCSLIILGQYLSTKDSGSVLSRSIPLAFREEKNRPQHKVDNFLKLKAWEEKGLSGALVDVMKLRPLVKNNFAEAFSIISKEMVADLTAKGKAVKSRILKNICAPLTIVAILTEGSPFEPNFAGQRIKFPFSFDEFFTQCRDLIISMTDTISESNALGEFWKYVEFLLDRGQIQEDFDYKIETHSSVTVVTDGEKIVKDFEKPTKLLFIRINGVHKHYQSSFKLNNNKVGMNEQTLMTYIKDQAYFVGMNPGSNFINEKGKKVSTSSYVLLYDDIGVNLERNIQEDDRSEIIITGRLFKDAEMLPLQDMVVFTIHVDVNKAPEGSAFTKMEKEFYKCYAKPQDNWKNELTQGLTVEVSGLLAVTKRFDKTYNQIDVLGYKVEMPTDAKLL